jgi:hypothetical protein
MPKVFLAPLLIAGLLLLPSCSQNQQADNCKSALSGVQASELLIRAKSERVETLESSNLQSADTIRKSTELYESIIEDSKIYYRIIINNPSCFSAERVAKAQIGLEEIESK